MTNRLTCSWCGRNITRGLTCRDCIRLESGKADTKDVALTDADGYWWNDHGIQRFSFHHQL